MKIKKFLLSILFTIIVFILFLSYSWDKKNIRIEKVTVYYTTTNEVIVIDKNGNFFSCWINSSNNLKQGETLKATFLTKGTKKREDDSLVRLNK